MQEIAHFIPLRMAGKAWFKAGEGSVWGDFYACKRNSPSFVRASFLRNFLKSSIEARKSGPPFVRVRFAFFKFLLCVFLCGTLKALFNGAIFTFSLPLYFRPPRRAVSRPLAFILHFTAENPNIILDFFVKIDFLFRLFELAEFPSI